MTKRQTAARVVAWSPDHATARDRRSPLWGNSGSPSVGRCGTVRRPCHNRHRRPCHNRALRIVVLLCAGLGVVCDAPAADKAPDAAPSLLMHCTVCHGAPQGSRSRFAQSSRHAQGRQIRSRPGARQAGAEFDPQTDSRRRDAAVRADHERQRPAVQRRGDRTADAMDRAGGA